MKIAKKYILSEGTIRNAEIYFGLSLLA